MLGGVHVTEVRTWTTQSAGGGGGGMGTLAGGGGDGLGVCWGSGGKPTPTGTPGTEVPLLLAGVPAAPAAPAAPAGGLIIAATGVAMWGAKKV